MIKGRESFRISIVISFTKFGVQDPYRWSSVSLGDREHVLLQFVQGQFEASHRSGHLVAAVLVINCCVGGDRHFWVISWKQSTAWREFFSARALCGQQREQKGQPNSQFYALQTSRALQRVAASCSLNLWTGGGEYINCAHVPASKGTLNRIESGLSSCSRTAPLYQSSSMALLLKSPKPLKFFQQIELFYRYTYVRA